MRMLAILITALGVIAPAALADRSAANEAAPGGQDALNAYLLGDHAEARRLFEALDPQTDPVVALNLAWMRRHGLGAAVDEPGARTLYRRAALMGSVPAQFHLGTMLIAGDGGPAFPDEGLVWLRRAAEAGHVEAQYRLGVNTLRGVGGSAADPAASLSWLIGAARRGHVGAKFRLGVLYLAGDGVAPDPVEATRLFREAAQAGHLGARTQLGLMHALGVGAPRDVALARRWLEPAAADGSQLARRQLAELPDPAVNRATPLASLTTRPAARAPAPVVPRAGREVRTVTALEGGDAGAVRLRLASYNSVDRLRQGWQRMRRLYPQILGAKRLSVSRVDLGDRGVFFRMEAGPMSDQTIAAKACRVIRRGGDDCTVVAVQ